MSNINPIKIFLQNRIVLMDKKQKLHSEKLANCPDK